MKRVTCTLYSTWCIMICLVILLLSLLLFIQSLYSISKLHLLVLITIDNGKYSTAVFDKRDSFTFNIVNFTHLSSNVLSKPAYGVYISQLVRIGRICSSFEQFKHRHYTLTQKLIKQGFWYSGLCIAFKRFAKYHAGIVSKYGCSVRKDIEEGICLPAIDGFLSRNICIRS